MIRPIQFHNHPYRFLLYIEWILLFLAAITEILPAPHLLEFPRTPLLTLLSIAAFGVMGLRMPTGRRVFKVIYTSLEIFFIVVAIAASIRLFPFLYVILVIRSCLIFDRIGRLAVTGLSFSLFLLTLYYRFQNLPAPPMFQERLRFTQVSFALLFGLSLVFLLLLMNAMLAERQSREQLRQYALRIEDIATLQERNRIARDIHDSLGHSLTALNLQLETALKLWQSNPAKAIEFLAEAKKLGSTALQDVRQSVSTLRSDPLQGRSLEDAIAILASEFYRTTGILPTCSIQIKYMIPNDVTAAIYRIVQEALTNICKYAAATEVIIQLNTTQKCLNLLVQDNGIGFNLEQNTSGFGLQGMRERTLALSGKFEINSAPNAGCRIAVFIPLQKIKLI